MRIRIAAITGLLALVVMVTPAAADPGQVLTMGQVLNTPLGLPGIHADTWGTWTYQGAVSGTTSGMLYLSGEMEPGSSGTSSCANYRVTTVIPSGNGHRVTDLSGEYVNGTLTLTGTSAGETVTMVLHYTYSVAACTNGVATSANATGTITWT